MDSNDTSSNINNQTNSTNPVSSSSSGSVFSAWYLWVGILAGILVIFGIIILLWYIAKANNKQILCFGPADPDEQNVEEEQKQQEKEPQQKDNQSSQKEKDNSKASINRVQQQESQKIKSEKFNKQRNTRLIQQSQISNTNETTNNDDNFSVLKPDVSTKLDMFKKNSGSSQQYQLYVNSFNEYKEIIKDDKKQQQILSENVVNQDRDINTPAIEEDNQEEDQIQENDQQKEQEDEDQGEKIEEEGERDEEIIEEEQKNYSERLQEILGPQKTDEYWEAVKDAIAQSAWEKYKMQNYIDQTPSIDKIRYFDTRPIIPPIAKYMNKPSTLHLTQSSQSTNTNSAANLHPLHYGSDYHVETSYSKTNLIQNSLSPYISRDQMQTGLYSNNFVSWINSHSQKVLAKTKNQPGVIGKIHGYQEPRPLSKLLFQFDQ